MKYTSFIFLLGITTLATDAWGVLRNKGFLNQFEGDWIIIHPDVPPEDRVAETLSSTTLT